MTTTELETIMFIGFGALARCVDPEKLPSALEYVNGNHRQRKSQVVGRRAQRSSIFV